MKGVRSIIASLMLFSLFVLPVGFPLTGLNNLSVQKGAIPSDWETSQVMPDPYLEESPTFMINGSSDEFSYSHDSIADSVNLTWAHTAGTSLDFINETEESNSPLAETECNDFVYFTQSFDWPYEIMPIVANMTLEFAVYLNDDFSSEDCAGLWFKLHVFVIDSSGNWESVYKSYPPYQNTTNQFRIDFSYIDLIEVWGGIVEDENETQEDPLDTLTVAVCLSPTSRFETFVPDPYLHPWMNVTGSVSCIVDTLKLDVFYKSEPDPGEILQPTYNGTWTTSANAILEDLVVADDGSAYTVGRISSYEQQAACLTITKWSAQAVPVWSKIWNGTNIAYGYGVAYHENHVYVVGEVYPTGDWEDDVDIVLMKLDTSGNIVWNNTWNTDGISRARDLAIASDGSIYVGGWFGYGEPLMNPTTAQIIKFDSNGDHLWNKTIGTNWGHLGYDISYWDAAYQVEIGPNDELYVSTMEYLMKLDTDGVVQWNYTRYDNGRFALTPDGGCVFLDRQYLHYTLFIEKISSSGDFEWNQTYRHNIVANLYDHLEGKDIAVAPDGTIHVAVVASRYEQAPLIIKYDAQGDFIEIDNLGQICEIVYTYRIEVSQDNLIHLAYGYYKQSLLIYDQTTASTTTTTTTTNTTTTFDIMTIGLVVGGGVIAAIVIVIAIKKFR